MESERLDRQSGRRLAVVAAGVVAVLVAAGILLLWPTGWAARAWDAAQLLRWMAAGETTQPVARHDEPVTALVGGVTRSYPADLYIAIDPDIATDPAASSAGLVLVPGASPGGKDEPLLVRFAEILAASGFTVLVPDLPGLRDQRVSPDHGVDIAAVAQTLSERVGNRPVAVAAISYAVGPAVIAVSRQKSAHPIGLVLGIGGYYDAIATTTYVTTGHVRDADGNWQSRTPNAYGKWVFVWSNLPRIASLADRSTLDAIARRKLDDPAQAVDDLVAALGPEGHAVWQLLDNADPDRVPALIETLPASIRNALVALDLAQHDLTSIDATLLLVHGADDPILPPEGSIALAGAAPNSELFLLDSLTHVDLSLESLSDAWTLYRASWSLIGWRDRLASAP
jgi:pimeloyl-ACP methyl ester carboxylesterase